MGRNAFLENTKYVCLWVCVCSALCRMVCFAFASGVSTGDGLTVASFICQRLPPLDELLISGCRARNLFSSTVARVPRTSLQMRLLILMSMLSVFIKNNLNKFPANCHHIDSGSGSGSIL